MKKIILFFLILFAIFAIHIIFNQKPNIETIILNNGSIIKNIDSKLDNILLINLNFLRNNKEIRGALTRNTTKIKIQDLWVDKFKVKQGDFYKFSDWIINNRNTKYFAKKTPKHWHFSSLSIDHGLSGQNEVAANNISFFDAYAYCKASNGRLPTNLEWQALAAGKNNKLYPWGDNFNFKAWYYTDERLNSTLKLGSFPETNTEDGLVDMGQIVSEWTQDKNEKAIIKGGNALSKPKKIFALNIVGSHKKHTYRSPFVGFRCVYDKKPTEKTFWQTKITAVKKKGDSYTLNNFKNSKILTILPFINYFSNYEIKKILEKKQAKKIVISRSEITVSQYKKFLAIPSFLRNLYANKKDPQNYSDTPYNWLNQLKNPNHPVVNINWWSAYKFAKWASARLPSAKEWFYMQIFTPIPVSSTIVSKEQKKGIPKTITKNSNDNLVNLYGNVSEWTNSIDSSSIKLAMVLKGGSYLISKKQTNDAGFFRSAPPSHNDRDIGFRVIFD